MIKGREDNKKNCQKIKIVLSYLLCSEEKSHNPNLLTQIAKGNYSL